MSASIVPMTMRDFFLDDPFFQSTWEDFDKVRDRMMSKSKKFWSESSIKSSTDSDENSCVSKTAEFSSNKSKNESSIMSKAEFSSNNSLKDHISKDIKDNDNRSNWMFPRGWLIPELRSEFRDIDLFKENNTEVIRMTNDDKKLEICLDTSQYKPSELKVLVKNGVISIEGKHEEKAEDGSKMVARQFVRRYTLPEGAKSEDVVSNLSTDGVLVITAKKSPVVDRFVEISNADASSNAHKGISRESYEFDSVSKTDSKISDAKEFLSQTIKSAINTNSQERHSLKNVDSNGTESDIKRLNVPIKINTENIRKTSEAAENEFKTKKVVNAQVHNSAAEATTEASSNASVNKLNNSKTAVEDKENVDIVQNDKNMQQNQIKNEMNCSNRRSSITSSNERRHSAQEVLISSNFQAQSSKSSQEKTATNHLQEDRKELSNESNRAKDVLTNEFDTSMVDFEDRTGWHSLRSWFFPKFTESKHSDVIKVEENEDKLELQLDASKYKPDELRVSVEHGTITVEGKHEEKAEDGQVMVSRQFIRKYSLPAGARAEDVVSDLTADGVLVITANKSKMYKQKVEVEIKHK